jgi:uncharacterized protein (TIGR02118 family)
MNIESVVIETPQIGRRSALSALSAAALLASLGDTARAQSSGGAKLTVLIKPQKDPEAFTKYYLGTHMPLVSKTPGVTRFEVATIMAPPPGQPASPYYRITEVYWESVEAMKKSMATPEWKAVVDDVPKFADPGTLSGFTSVIGA